MTIKILKLLQVEEKVGKKKSSIYADIQAGTFPAPIALGSRSSGWIEAEIDRWIQERIEAREMIATSAKGSKPKVLANASRKQAYNALDFVSALPHALHARSMAAQSLLAEDVPSQHMLHATSEKESRE